MLSYSSILKNWQKYEWGLKLLLKIVNPLKSKLLPIYSEIRWWWCHRLVKAWILKDLEFLITVVLGLIRTSVNIICDIISYESVKCLRLNINWTNIDLSNKLEQWRIPYSACNRTLNYAMDFKSTLKVGAACGF